MKIFNKTSIAAALLVSALGVSSANALTLQSLPDTSSPKVNYVIHDGVATIHGNVGDFLERAAAERYVLNLKNVDRVINLVTYQ